MDEGGSDVNVGGVITVRMTVAMPATVRVTMTALVQQEAHSERG